MPGTALTQGDRTKRLTDKEEAFAADVARGMPMAKAYRKHYSVSEAIPPNTVSTKASKLAGRVKVHARIQELRKEFREQATREHVFDEMTWFKQAIRISFADVRKLVHEDGRPKQVHELDDDTAQAVSAVVFDANGRASYKMHPKAEFMNMLAKKMGLFELDNRQQGMNLLRDFFAGLGYAGRIQAKDEIPGARQDSLPAPVGQIPVKE